VVYNIPTNGVVYCYGVRESANSCKGEKVIVRANSLSPRRRHVFSIKGEKKHIKVMRLAPQIIINMCANYIYYYNVIKKLLLLFLMPSRIARAA